jgi:hypothetical protein
MIRKLALATALAFAPLAGFAGETPAPEGAMVYFINIADGASVAAPVKVQFGLSGMGVAPAGTDRENTGHHHIFINRAPFGDGADDAYLIENGIPADDNHKHFGGGQTEIALDLAPGSHTLQLVLGDQYHIPHNPPVVSDVITITVTE